MIISLQMGEFSPDRSGSIWLEVQSGETLWINNDQKKSVRYFYGGTWPGLLLSGGLRFH